MHPTCAPVARAPNRPGFCTAVVRPHSASEGWWPWHTSPAHPYLTTALANACSRCAGAHAGDRHRADFPDGLKELLQIRRILIYTHNINNSQPTSLPP